MTDKDLIERWRRFVLQVENGFEGGLEEYRRGLDVRAVIARRGLDPAVSAEDDRYRGRLTGVDTRIWETPQTPGFWEFGYPSDAKGELLADLQSDGLL